MKIKLLAILWSMGIAGIIFPQAIASETQRMEDRKVPSTKEKVYLDLVPIDKTRLFSSIAKNCSIEDLRTWRHPVRSVLIERGAKIEQVQLCNDRVYPIFFVRFPYDPQGQTASYFSPLYNAMRRANGGYPFSFVSVADNTIINVSYRQNGWSKVEYERYRS
jgi:hypothetical protein